MANEKIEYGYLVEAALRTVVRDVMGRLARGEVPEPHHFYITFRTGHPGVEMPDFLFARYPREMTIVLQHQYWDLEVRDDDFSVTLSFNDKPEQLTVPYDAIKVFADPGVEFGLHFTLDPQSEYATVKGPSAETVPLRSKPRVIQSDVGADDGEPAPGEGAETVTLARFRKK